MPLLTKRLNRMAELTDQSAGARDGQTEQRILDAAHRVFLRSGTAGARMQDIAREAGVNQALLHYYFRSKDRLAQAVFQRAARQLFPPLVAILGSDAGLQEKVRRVVDQYIDTLRRTPHLPGYLLGELHQHPERAQQLFTALTGMRIEGIAPGVFARLGAQIEADVAAGRIRPIDPRQFVVNLASLCIFPFAARPMIAVLLGVVGDEAFDAFIEERKRVLPELFWRGLQP